MSRRRWLGWVLPRDWVLVVLERVAGGWVAYPAGADAPVLRPGRPSRPATWPTRQAALDELPVILGAPVREAVLS